MTRTCSARLVHAAFGLAVATLGTGCPLVEVEVEVREVCVTHRDIAIPGVPADVAGSIDETFTVDDLSAFEALDDLDADARFVSATVRATHGVDSLAFIESASVEVASADPASTLPTLMVYACDGDCAADGNALALPVHDQPDALAYLRSGSVSIALRATGSLPTHDWTMDVELCVAARASYALEP